MAIEKIESLTANTQCLACGADLASGTAAYIDTDDNSYFCIACVEQQSAPPEDTAALPEEPLPQAKPPVETPPSPAPELQNLWNRFFSYQAACLKSDLIDGLISVNSSHWVCVGDDCEAVISQGDRILPLGDDLERLVSKMEPGQSLQYGWPLMAVETAEGLKVAPLLVVDLAPPPYTGSIAVYGNPVINPAILRALWSHSGDITFLRSQLSDGLPTGAVAMSRFVQHILDIMGIQYPELDPLSLRREMPTAPGVYNTALAVLVQGIDQARQTVEELRRIASTEDWKNTAAAGLFGVELTGSSDHEGMPVMPWSAEPVFEDALQMIRSKPLTVFDMSQRDVIDQLIVSACANTWMDNESVLVVSDDEKKLDEMAHLASDVHSAMLIRTSCDSDLAQNPMRKATSLSNLAAILLEESRSTSGSIKQILERSYKDLQVVEGLRRTALDGYMEHSTLQKEKQQLEIRRLELAKRLWTHGLYPAGTDPYELGQRAKQLSRSWLFRGLRTKFLLRDMKTKPNASLDDVLNWCLDSLAIKKIEGSMAGTNDPDKYNVGAANYRWAASSISAVSARVSSALPGCIAELEALQRVKGRDLQTKRAVNQLLPHLRAWACDYYSANAFFDLRAGMFDMVILDNANRVNLCWALPLVYRAKRAVIIGDTASQPPSVFLDSLQLDNMAARFEFERESMLERCLDYMNSSVYSAFANA